MDDKELIKRIKNSRSVGLSRAEITRRLQEKGYRLEYIDALIKKASFNKVKIIILCILMILIIACLGYFLLGADKKMNLPNPLYENVIYNLSASNYNSEINLTPKFITYLLNEMGGYKLHKNILTGEPAIVDFKISGKNFYSIIDGNIESFEGSHSDADLQILASKEDVISAVQSDNPKEFVENSVEDGKIKVILFASRGELLAKGYWGLYSS